MLFEQFGVTRASLQLDAFASATKGAIESATLVRWNEIAAATRRLEDLGIEIDIQVNGTRVEELEGIDLVRSFAMNGRLVKIAGLESDAAILMRVMVEAFSEISTAGLGWQDGQFEIEGSKQYRFVTTYERSPINRRLAIEIHGVTCAVCSFNFGEVYGSLGDEVVEIHHTLPVHLMEKESVVDPRTDLVPLCSNCHTMVHRVDPPLGIEELKLLIEAKVKASGVHKSWSSIADRRSHGGPGA